MNAKCDLARKEAQFQAETEFEAKLAAEFMNFDNQKKQVTKEKEEVEDLNENFIELMSK